MCITRQYYMQIEKLSGKEKLYFIEVIKGCTYIRIMLGFSFLLAHKTNKTKGRWNRKTD